MQAVARGRALRRRAGLHHGLLGLLVGLVLVFGLLGPRLAWAASKVRLTLEVEDDEIPTNVCIFHGLDPTGEAAGLATGDRLSAEFDHERPEALRWQFEPSSSSRAPEDCLGCKRVAERKSKVDRYYTCASSDEGEGGLVVLSIKANEKSDTLARVGVEGLRVSGKVVEFEITHRPDKTTLLLASRGGDYNEESSVQVLPSGEARLEIQKRCRWATMERPAVVDDGRVSESRVSIDGSTLDRNSCVRGDLDSKQDLEVLLPSRVPRETELVFEQRVDGESSTEFRATWAGQTPAQLPLEIAVFSFAWRRDSCFYLPDRTCPAAQITESGLDCEAVERDGEYCYYRCPTSLADTGRASTGVIPGESHITFEDVGADQPGARGPSQEWTVELNYLNQRLEGHVAPGERRIDIDVECSGQRDSGFCQRAVFDAPGDRVETLELEYVSRTGELTQIEVELEDLDCGALGRGPECERRSVDAADLERRSISMPDAACGNEVSYRYFGERSYTRQRSVVQSGELRIEAPERTARRLYFTAQASGGLALPPLAPNAAPDNSLVTPQFDFGIGLSQWLLWRGRPKHDPPLSSWRGMRLEYLFVATYSAVAAWPLDPDAFDQRSDNFARVPYWRLGAGLTVLTPWWRAPSDTRMRGVAVSGGLGMALVIGRAAFQRDARVFDPEFRGYDFGMRPSGEVRIRLTRRGGLQLFGRYEMFLLEDDIGWTTDGKGQAEVDLNEHLAFRHGLVLGLAVDL